MHSVNPRRAKINRPYTIHEAAKALGVHRNTVRNWIKTGLEVCDDQQPTLILGSTLLTFLQAKRKKNKRPCAPGEIFCVQCRLPKEPAGGVVDYRPSSEFAGALVGNCPDCGAVIYRRTSLSKLQNAVRDLRVSITQPHPRIVDTR